MGIYSLGVGCVIIVSVIAYLFFSTKRKNTKMHRIYGAMIVTALTHLLVELGALYTLTHVETVPAWITRGVHQIFLLLFLVLFYEVYLYILAMINEEIEKPLKTIRLLLIPFVLSTIGVLVLPIYYKHEAAGSYSYGPGIIVVYISVYLWQSLLQPIWCVTGKSSLPKTKQRAYPGMR